MKRRITTARRPFGRQPVDVVLRSGPFGGYIAKPAPKATRRGGKS